MQCVVVPRDAGAVRRHDTTPVAATHQLLPLLSVAAAAALQTGAIDRALDSQDETGASGGAGAASAGVKTKKKGFFKKMFG